MPEAPTIHVRLYNPNQQHLAAQIARVLALAGYSVGDVEHAAPGPTFSGVQVQPGPGNAAEAVEKIVAALRAAGVVPVKLLGLDPSLPAGTVQVGVENY